MNFVGIDVGTSACKICAYNQHGKLLVKKQSAYRVHSPHAQWAEVDALEMKQTVLSVLKDVASTLDTPLSGIAVSSQGEGVVALNEKMEAISPIILSYDTRNQAEYEDFEQCFGSRQLFEHSGQINSTAVTAAKIKWLAAHGYAGTKYCCVGDYINLCLCGEAITDYSLAARTMLLNIHQLQWEKEYLDFLSITEEQLPLLGQAGRLQRRISSETAQVTGIPESCILAAGGHDQACGLYGACGSDPDAMYYSIGTTETLVCAMKAFRSELFQYGLPCYPHVEEHKYITLPGNYTGAVLLSWYKNTLYQTRQIGNDSIYEEMISHMSEVPSNLLVLPHFTISGSPYNDTQPCGAILGLRLTSTRDEITRALLEGCSMEIALNLSLLQQLGISSKELIASGTITKYPNVMQLKSDVLNLPIRHYRKLDAAAMGAARLAAEACGVSTASWNRSALYQDYTPNAERAAFYQRQMRRYEKLYPAVKSVMK